jgi:hypothetical protein
MVKVTSKDETARRIAERSIETFLSGKQSQKWLIGVIRESGINKEALKKLFSEAYTRHLGNLQLLELEKACKQMGFL